MIFNKVTLVHPSCQDDPPAMDFVTAAANLRMHIFSMNMKSRFDVKCKLSHTFPAETCHLELELVFLLCYPKLFQLWLS